MGGAVIGCQAQHREGSSIATGQLRCVASSWAVSHYVYVWEFEYEWVCVCSCVSLRVSIFCGALAGCALWRGPCYMDHRHQSHRSLLGQCRVCVCVCVCVCVSDEWFCRVGFFCSAVTDDRAIEQCVGIYECAQKMCALYLSILKGKFHAKRTVLSVFTHPQSFPTCMTYYKSRLSWDSWSHIISLHVKK